MRMIPALFVFHNDTCDTLTLDYGDVYMCSSSVTTVITVTTVIEKSDRAVTIVTIKIGAGLSSLAYLRIEDEKLFAADNIFFFLPIYLLTKSDSPFTILPWRPLVAPGQA